MNRRLARRLIGAAAGSILAASMMTVAPAWCADWRTFQPGFDRLISLHCTAKWVVHPDRAAFCIEEQHTAMMSWTESAVRNGTDPGLTFVLMTCRARWSALPNTNWVEAFACAESMLKASER